ncbi:DUF6079 family protein [Agromyces sp. H66]|uniref:DUF6079 family protein n=1 Tax=Agromyces sp. H66 TaxID=2529859 RepID=UPI0010AA7968|nr:DUF6079 family protein [Agromyces sp. H66]
MTELNLTSPLRDLINIPEKVDASDFVLQLHEGVEHADRTLSDYVVTDSIAESLDDALGIVERTFAERRAKGAFIHGSFGSGKSHFMAVLHLLLTGNLTARKLDGLASVVDRRSGVLARNVLAIDYHLLGAKSFEDELFNGYLKTVRNSHPHAPTPMLHVSDSLLADAANARARMGDAAFFAAISTGADDGWGDFSAPWDAESFDAAIRAGGAERDRLVTDLTSTLYQSYTHAGQWLDISTGLERMTEHAKSLGYDGIVLFLDELVLWLGQHLSDSAFIQEETSKVAKLVETGVSSLPIPIVSFVARQRDLKDFLGDSIDGAQQQAIGQSFQWWEDRFERIELKAADLPKIVKQRLLAPTSDAAASVLGDALASVKRSGAWTYLMTDEVNSDEQDFADVYPFSPALVDSMIALSSLMQRERTALKLMGELLADGRSELTASDVVPVGDLFDQIMTGSSTPLTNDMKRRFSIARSFYEEKFRPFLLNKHNLMESDARALGRKHPFRTEDRLAKTLLVADLAPGAASLRNLTAAKLAALNYGTINSYVPGAEAQQVRTWVGQWAQQFGEVSIGEGVDPLIAIHLSGVDYDSILERVASEDNPSNRRVLIRDLVQGELKLTGGGLIREKQLTHVWRGRKRNVVAIFGNVRDQNDVRDEDLISSGDEWKLVIDYPYDADGRPPTDDLARLSDLQDEGVESQTIVWIPNFLTQDRLADLGKLVKLEHVLLPNQFDQNSSHLPATDREPARQALENQRKTLRTSIVSALRQAYAVSSRKSGDVDDDLTPSEVFSTLFRGLKISPPVADDLLKGLQSALEQAWAVEFPEHPAFEPSGAEIRTIDLRRVVELVETAVSAGGRAEGLARPEQEVLKRIAVPLGLGTLSENVFVASMVEFRWRDTFSKWAAEADDRIDVKTLRDRLATWGMARDVEDALIASWALIADREWVRGETAVPAPAVGSIPNDLVLRSANLPSEADWKRANEVAAAVFGMPKEHARISTAVRRFGDAVQPRAREAVPAADGLVTELIRHAGDLGIATDAPVGRLATARRAQSLVSAVAGERNPLVMIERLAATELGTDVTPLARSTSSAAALQRKLAAADWDTFRAADALDDAPEAAHAIGALRAAASENEYVSPLGEVLDQAMVVARQAVLARVRKAEPGPGPMPRPGDGASSAGSTLAPRPDGDSASGAGPIVNPDEVVLPDVASITSNIDALRDEIRSAMEQAPGKRVRIKWWLE